VAEDSSAPGETATEITGNIEVLEEEAVKGGVAEVG